MRSEPIVRQELRFIRSTKRTHVFEAAGDDAKVRSIYVDKSAFDGLEAPGAIVLTVTEGKAAT